MSQAPEFPQSLRERYVPAGVLGAGGFGTVFLAQDQRSRRQVAIKLLHVVDDEVRARFDREARVTAALHHPHVVRVYDSGIAAQGSAFIVYEYVEGPDLARVLMSERLPVEDVMRIGIALADALDTAHRQGVVHRDVKPPNVLLRGGRDPVLTDFGIARVAAGETMQTAAGVILGTPPYLAPEIFAGAPPSAASDQFALAATLIEALTGHGVYPGDDLTAVIAALNQPEPCRFPREFRGRFGPLEAILTRAAASDPSARYPSCAALAEALGEAWKGLSEDALPVVGTPTVQLPRAVEVTPTPARVVGPTPAPPAGGERRPWGIGLAVLLAVGLAVGWRGSAPPPASSVATAAPSPPVMDPEDLRLVAARRQDLDEAVAAMDALFPVEIPHRGVHSKDFAVEHAQTLISAEVLEAFRRLVRALDRWMAALSQSASESRASILDEPDALGLVTAAVRRIQGVVGALESITESGAGHFRSLAAIGIVAGANRALREARREQLELAVAILDLPREQISMSLLAVAGYSTRMGPLAARVEAIEALEQVLGSQRAMPPEELVLATLVLVDLMESIASDGGLPEDRCEVLEGLAVDVAGHLARIPPPPVAVNRLAAAFGALEVTMRMRDRCGIVISSAQEKRVLGEIARLLREEVALGGVPIPRSPGRASLLRELAGQPEAVDVRVRELRAEITGFLDEDG